MGYETAGVMVDKWLQPDGSITTLDGTLVYPPDAGRAALWERAGMLPNKWLQPDGSIGGMTGGTGGGGGGVTSYNALPDKPRLENATLLSGNNTMESLKLAHTHAQNVAAAVWTVPHNLNAANVSVQVIDNAGDEIFGDVAYTNANALTITFAHALAGVARVRR